MEKKNYLTLDNEFLDYCRINNIKDPLKLAKQIFQRGFTIVKYGETPAGFSSEPTVIEKEVIKEVEKIIEVEKIVEKIKEVPVEVIKEVKVEVPVGVIKEVPIKVEGKKTVVTKEVIKEVPVEKIVEVIKEVTNTEEVDKLTEENKKLKDELDLIKSSLDSLGRKGRFMKDSNLDSLYGE